MELRNAAQEMAKGCDGGWTTMASSLGMSLAALENRVYERKGQEMSVHEFLQMQAFSGKTSFAEAVARLSGGVFLKLPDVEQASNEELLVMFNALYSKVGKLASRFNEAIADGEVCEREKKDLNAIKTQIHASVEALLQVTYTVYGRPAGE